MVPVRRAGLERGQVAIDPTGPVALRLEELTHLPDEDVADPVVESADVGPEARRDENPICLQQAVNAGRRVGRLVGVEACDQPDGIAVGIGDRVVRAAAVRRRVELTDDLHHPQELGCGIFPRLAAGMSEHPRQPSQPGRREAGAGVPLCERLEPSNAGGPRFATAGGDVGAEFQFGKASGSGSRVLLHERRPSAPPVGRVLPREVRLDPQHQVRHLGGLVSREAAEAAARRRKDGFDRRAFVGTPNRLP